MQLKLCNSNFETQLCNSNCATPILIEINKLINSDSSNSDSSDSDSSDSDSSDSDSTNICDSRNSDSGNSSTSFSQFEFLSFVTPQHLDNRPLSGQLFAILAMFNIFVDKITKIFDASCDPVSINNIPQNCLLWADDLLVFSTSAEGLQNSIDKKRYFLFLSRS